MSDYEDEYDDYDVEFFYVEDEYMAADDLAEHAVASPPPATCGDEDMEDDWDRFDYYNDLEYASDGYDDTKFQAHDVKGAKASLKRKRPVSSRPRKKRATQTDPSKHVEPSAPAHSPIVWRSQADRGLKPKTLDDDAQPYALFKNWREKLADTPHWARGSPPNSPDVPTSRSDKDKGKTAFITEPASPPYDDEEDDDDDAMDEEGGAISQEALLAALQRQLAAAGGPLSGMDPQQLLEFATRMATDKDAGDDIAGEMADAMLGGEYEEEDADADEKLLSWVAQQRNGNNNQPAEAEAETEPKPTEQPPTPPPSNPNRSVRASQTSTAPSVPTLTNPPAESKTTKSSLKRKAAADPADEGVTKVAKKRTTRSFDAPTAASQAKAAPSKPVTRSRAARRG